MGLVRRQIDDNLGVALKQKTVEIGVIGARTEALLGCSRPLFNLVTDRYKGRLAVQAVKLWQIDTLCHLAAPHHPNSYGAHGETPPFWTAGSRAGAHGIPQHPIADHLNAGVANIVGQLCTLEGGMVGHSGAPVGRHRAQFGSIAGRVHEETRQSW